MSLQTRMLGEQGREKAGGFLPTDEKADLEGMSELPDLTTLLQKQFILGEFVAWMHGSMKWHKEDATGAKGEDTLEDLENRSSEFQTWHPTVKTCSFRRSIAFWGPAMRCEGCLLFLWIDLIRTYAIGTPELLYELTKVPNLVGGTFFLGGIYLVCFELINRDSEKLNHKNIHYLGVHTEAVADLRIEKASYVGSFMYLIGAVLYTISQVAAFWHSAPLWHNRLIDGPLILGGFLFFTGGLCELKINKVFTSAPTRLVWWVSVLNCYGGLTFWLSACPALFPGKLATRFAVTGTITYLLAAVLSLLMWRGEQFGGALIPALNGVAQVAVKSAPNANGQLVLEAQDDDSSRVEDDLHPRLSWIGLIFLVVYVCMCTFSVIACCMCLNLGKVYQADPETFQRMLNLFMTGIVNIINFHMVLIILHMVLRVKFEDATYYYDFVDYFGDAAHHDAGLEP